MAEAKNIYDSLIKFESRKHRGIPYPVHKKLKQPLGSGTLLDWLITCIPFKKDDNILDAGCGTGYTLFYLHNLFHIRGRGISISSNEIDYARIYARENGLEKYIQFELDSFTTHRLGNYTKILCIESLKHSAALEQTIDNLLYNLSPGGTMVIIDDFIKHNNRHIDKQKRLWDSPAFDYIERYTDEINKKKSVNIRIIDLTEFVPVRSVWKINLLLVLSTIYNGMSLGKGIRNVNTYRGGLILEKLYARNKIDYRAIIVENKN